MLYDSGRRPWHYELLHEERTACQREASQQEVIPRIGQLARLMLAAVEHDLEGEDRYRGWLDDTAEFKELAGATERAGLFRIMVDSKQAVADKQAAAKERDAIKFVAKHCGYDFSEPGPHRDRMLSSLELLAEIPESQSTVTLPEKSKRQKHDRDQEILRIYEEDKGAGRGSYKRTAELFNSIYAKSEEVNVEVVKKAIRNARKERAAARES